MLRVVSVRRFISISGLLTICPRIDRMIFRRSHVGVRVFPVEVDGVVQVDKHHVGDGAFAPTVATDTSMAIEISPVLLLIPFLVAVPPTELLERRVVRSIPQVHP